MVIARQDSRAAVLRILTDDHLAREPMLVLRRAREERRKLHLGRTLAPLEVVRDEE